MRKSGILLPITSLPSPYGIGCFSKEAYDFVDRLKQAGQSFWQMLPLGPTSYGDSPYQSFSTFAGNPYFIDLQDLIHRGWLTKEKCKECDFGGDEGYVDYGKIYENRFVLLREAYENSNIMQDEGFHKFSRENEHWLEDYALYMAVKASFGNISWVEWDEDIKLRKPSALERYRKKFTDEVNFYRFQQYLFFQQWEELKRYANKNGIQIIGDIPIYVALDSSDAWANPELFLFDENSTPVAVAGCPPDAFSETGQLWGNPLYRWDYHKQTGYAWWMRRMASCYERYDVVRIDHFRGFDTYYSIPFGELTAENGTWVKGPGFGFFEVMRKKLGEKEVIAEDLGFLTPSVIELVKRSGYPGMKVLQFAFDSREESDYLPHNYTHNCVVYTGTHDNDTVAGWLETLDGKDKELCIQYLNLSRHPKTASADKEHPWNCISWEFIRAAMASVAFMAIIPMQDYLGLGTEARINIPSTIGSNWRWRMRNGDFTEELAEKIKAMTKLYGRLPKEEN